MVNKKENPKIKVTFYIEPDLNEDVEALAKKYHLSKSQLFRNFIRSGCDDAKLLDSVGILQTLNFGINLFDRLKSALLSGTVKVDGENIKFPIK